MNIILKAYRNLIVSLTQRVDKLLEEKRRIVLLVAIDSIGKDVAPIHDELACAESVNNIVQRATGEPIGGGASTYLLYHALKKGHKQILKPKAGDIIISPTGYGRRGTHGHVGIMLDNKQIMSNNSKTGLWEQNYTTQKWFENYKIGKGYPIYYYRLYK